MRDACGVKDRVRDACGVKDRVRDACCVKDRVRVARAALLEVQGAGMWLSAIKDRVRHVAKRY